jgi:hypothetical protein
MFSEHLVEKCVGLARPASCNDSLQELGGAAGTMKAITLPHLWDCCCTVLFNSPSVADDVHSSTFTGGSQGVLVLHNVIGEGSVRAICLRGLVFSWMSVVGKSFETLPLCCQRCS